MKAEQRTVEISREELEALVKRAEEGKLQQGDAQIIRAIIEQFIVVHTELGEKNISIRRLKRIPVFVKEVVACRKFMAKPSLDWRMDSRPYASPD